MKGRIRNILLCFTVCVTVMVNSSASSLRENIKLEEVLIHLNGIRAEMGELKAKNLKLTSDLKELKSYIAAEAQVQDQEIQQLKTKISQLESKASYEANKTDDLHSNKNNGGPSLRLNVPPKACVELTSYGNTKLDGIFLVKDETTNQIKAVFCRFGNNEPENIIEEPIGNVDVKTKSIHFYVQRSTSFSRADAVIPFELERLNEGNAMNLNSGVFTAPVDEIYHFEFFGLKSPNANILTIFLQVNGSNVGRAYTSSSALVDNVSLTASLSLKANDRVNLFNYQNGALFDDSTHSTHFTGWLVDEYL